VDARTTRQVWTRDKRPAQHWVVRDARNYEKGTQWQPPPELPRLPSHREKATAGDAEDTDVPRRHSGAGASALRRLSLAHNKENHAKVSPGIWTLLQTLQQGGDSTPSPVEPLTEGGLSVSAMQAALASLPRSPARRLDGASTARAMEDAFEVAACRRKDTRQRPTPQRFDARLARLEKRLVRELQPESQEGRIRQLLRKHRERLQHKFAEWDVDGDGQISKGELEEVMTSLGLKVRQGEIDEFFDEFDPDGSGALDLKEFYSAAYSGGMARFGSK